MSGIGTPDSFAPYRKVERDPFEWVTPKPPVAMPLLRIFPGRYSGEIFVMLDCWDGQDHHYARAFVDVARGDDLMQVIEMLEARLGVQV